MPPIDRELMQQAADKLSIMVGYPGLRLYHEDIRAVLTALRERLAQPQRTHWDGCDEVHPECKQLEQEPVAHTLNCVCGAVWDISLNGAEEMVHTPDAPKPRREWVVLTDDEIDAVWVDYQLDGIDVARAIEAKLKEKNNG